jgi:pimeloyl-ACP methyl ester carboxylesterase
MTQPIESGYAPINGMQLYWESLGSGGTPVVVSHGGFCAISLLRLAERRRVIALELQGHGHTADIDRRLGYDVLGDDIAAVIEHFGLGQADLLGYSFGAGASLRAAIQHPLLVRRLVSVSMPCRRDGWFPEVRAGMDNLGRSLFGQMSQSPLYAAWKAAAPDPEAFPRLMDKMGELVRSPYDWTEEVRHIRAATMLVFGDADSVPASHAAEFYALLGGGLKDADWDGSGKGVNRLAILPGQTHYDIFESAQLAAVVDEFLAA